MQKMCCKLNSLQGFMQDCQGRDLVLEEVTERNPTVQHSLRPAVHCCLQCAVLGFYKGRLKTEGRKGKEEGQLSSTMKSVNTHEHLQRGRSRRTFITLNKYEMPLECKKGYSIVFETGSYSCKCNYAGLPCHPGTLSL